VSLLDGKQANIARSRPPYELRGRDGGTLRSARFQAVSLAQARFRQSGVLSSHPDVLTGEAVSKPPAGTRYRVLRDPQKGTMSYSASLRG
jgi:hypothetical protein